MIAASVIGFSILNQASSFIFIPQTSVVAFASFFIFILIVTLITLIIYPIILILIVNFCTSYISNNNKFKVLLKLGILIISFTIGVFLFTNQYVSLISKIQIVIIWLGLYFVLAGLYLTHIAHNDILQLSKTKILFMAILLIIMSRPLVFIYLHTSEALNFTNINPQVYLNSSNCVLLQNLDQTNNINKENDILYNPKYYRELPNGNGCYLYGNTIRYSFAYDYVLLVKRNIVPLVGRGGNKYNEYVRLSCYAGNCYSENYIFYKDREDIYSALIRKGARLDRPL